jgi:hypothetical protein
MRIDETWNDKLAATVDDLGFRFLRVELAVLLDGRNPSIAYENILALKFGVGGRQHGCVFDEDSIAHGALALGYGILSTAAICVSMCEGVDAEAYGRRTTDESVFVRFGGSVRGIVMAPSKIPCQRYSVMPSFVVLRM